MYIRFRGSPVGGECTLYVFVCRSIFLHSCSWSCSYSCSFVHAAWGYTHIDGFCFWHSFKCIGTQINGFGISKLCCQICAAVAAITYSIAYSSALPTKTLYTMKRKLFPQNCAIVQCCSMAMVEFPWMSMYCMWSSHLCFHASHILEKFV